MSSIFLKIHIMSDGNKMPLSAFRSKKFAATIVVSNNSLHDKINLLPSIKLINRYRPSAVPVHDRINSCVSWRLHIKKNFPPVVECYQIPSGDFPAFHTYHDLQTILRKVDAFGHDGTKGFIFIICGGRARWPNQPTQLHDATWLQKTYKAIASPCPALLLRLSRSDGWPNALPPATSNKDPAHSI